MEDKKDNNKEDDYKEKTNHVVFDINEPSIGFVGRYDMANKEDVERLKRDSQKSDEIRRAESRE